MNIKVDTTRYEITDEDDYIAVDADEDAPIVYINISSTFGDVYLS